MEQKGEFQAVAPVAERQSKSMGLVLAVVFLALCTLVLGGLYCYEKFIAKGDGSSIANSGESKDCNEEAQKIDGVEKSEILGVATADADLQVRSLIKDVEKAWIKETHMYNSMKVYGENGPMLKLESGNMVEASKFYGLVVSDFDKVGKDSILDVLAKNKLVRDENYFVHSQTEQFYYVNDNIVCQLYDVMTNKMEYHLSCANKEWVSDEDETLANALINAYNEKASSKIDYMFGTSAEKIVKKDSGYQTIEVSVGDAAALFYRKNEDSEWKFFTETQGVLLCGDYSTDELREAYKGDPCYEGDVETTLK